MSKVERGEAAPPSEAKIVALAHELGEDADVLLAMAGKVSKARSMRWSSTRPGRLMPPICRFSWTVSEGNTLST